MRTWADSYTQAVRQRTGCQETTMAKTETLPHYLYSNKISEVARTTETYSADTFRSSGVENEVPDMTDQDEVPEVKSTKKRKQVSLTLQVNRRMIYFQHRPVLLPAWMKGLFSWSVVRQDSVDHSRLTQGSSHKYVVIVSRATTEWAQNM